MSFHHCLCLRRHSRNVWMVISFVWIIQNFGLIYPFLRKFKSLLFLLFLLEIFSSLWIRIWRLFLLKIWCLRAVNCDFWNFRKCIILWSSRRSKYLWMFLWDIKSFLCTFVAILEIDCHLINFTKVFNTQFKSVLIMLNRLLISF